MRLLQGLNRAVVVARPIPGSANDAPAIHGSGIGGQSSSGERFRIGGVAQAGQTIAGNDQARDLVLLTVDYGDGTQPQSLTPTGNQRFRLEHRYQSPGVYRVTVTVQDDDGGADDGSFLVLVDEDKPRNGGTNGNGAVVPAGLNSVRNKSLPSNAPGDGVVILDELNAGENDIGIGAAVVKGFAPQTQRSDVAGTALGEGRTTSSMSVKPGARDHQPRKERVETHEEPIFSYGVGRADSRNGLVHAARDRYFTELGDFGRRDAPRIQWQWTKPLRPVVSQLDSETITSGAATCGEDWPFNL